VDFVLALHSHLPYVLRHGRWPHGSDWLCEAALDAYLPLIEKVSELAARGVRAPLTVSVSPVLANQLADPLFATELDEFIAQRLVACEEARRTLPETGDGALVPLVDFWEDRFRWLRARFEAEGGDIVAALARLQDAGHVEVMTCAATHGYLTLLGREESVRLQLGLAQAEHRRLFGRASAGCWLPECAYRPRGWWEPSGALRPGPRAGTEEFLAEAGFRYFFTDAHLAAAGSALGGYTDVPMGVERFDAARRDVSRYRGDGARRTPYRSYLAGSAGGSGRVAVLVRDPRSSMQVWSRQLGYPGDGWYLEFHKIRWPGGLKLWRVSAPNSDLGAKRPYDPSAALAQAALHGSHFASLLSSIQAAGEGVSDDLIAVPFDTELFGHWWFEGVDFLAAVYRNLADGHGVHAVTASEHLGRHPPTVGIDLAPGSWGAGGDDGMWLNEQTAWTWRRLWPLEDRFWNMAPLALALPEAHPLLEQAARELLLAQSSDWQFIISTGAVVDYAERRFAQHAADAELLVGVLEDASRGAVIPARAFGIGEELRRRDALFPELLPHIAAALERGAVGSIP
jgi:1,4-alpha-glucan branching enzyme